MFSFFATEEQIKGMIIIEKRRMIMTLPKDPVILLSYVNTQLRDNFSSLEDFCKSNNISEAEVMEPLSAIDYQYDKETNQFV